MTASRAAPVVCIQKARGSSPLSSTGQSRIAILKAPEESQTKSQDWCYFSFRRAQHRRTPSSARCPICKRPAISGAGQSVSTGEPQIHDRHCHLRARPDAFRGASGSSSRSARRWRGAAAGWLTAWVHCGQGDGSAVSGVVYSNAADAVSRPHLRASSVASLPGPGPVRGMGIWEIMTRPAGAVMAQGWSVGQSPMTAATIRAIARTSVRRPSSRPGLRAICSPKLTIAAVFSSGHRLAGAVSSSTVMPRRIAVSYRRARGPGSPGAGTE